MARRLRAFRGGRINLKRLTPRRKRWLEKRRRKFFQEDMDFDRVRGNNKKRALYGVIRKGKIKVLEDAPDDHTIIDVADILRKNSNN
tara:strand:- start:39 stop:299 length:261 start_codon:yes stop_codon:yes gene_type:complete